MAEFTEVMKWKEKMCSECNPENCLLDIVNNGNDMICNRFITKYPKEAEEIIMGWAKEHPIMTNAQKFKEVFGINKPLTSCEGFFCQSRYDCNNCRYKDFWEQEYKEPEQEDL